MANYNVDIAVAIKNAQALKKFNKDVKQTSNIVDDINLKIRRASNAYEKSLNTLSSSLQKTKVNINKAAVGTDAFRKSALDLVRAEKSLNRELALKNKLLEQLRKNEDQFGLAQSSSSNRVRRNVAASRRSRISSKFKTLDTPTPSIDLRNRVRENLRQSRISRFGSGFTDFNQNFEQRIAQRNQAEFQRNQIEIKNRVRQNINKSKFGRFASGFRDFSQSPDPITSSLIPGQSLFGQSVNIESKLQQALAKQTANKKRAEEEVAKIRETALKKIEIREKKLILLRKKSLKQEIQDRRRLNRLNQTNVAGRASGFKAFSQRADEITAQSNRPGLGQIIGSQFAQGGMFAATRSQRIKGSISNALIGGGFPLLFGQGALGAAGGGIGGAVGGALGGPFGFGLSIAGTAIAQRIQEGRDFQKQVDQLNKSIRLTGGESEFSVASIKKLGKELGLTKQEALKAAQSFEAFGAAARINLIKTFGDEATFNTLKNLRKTVDVLNNIDFIEKKIGKRRADQVVDIVLAAGGLEAQKFILEEIFKLQMEEAKKGNLKGMNKFRATLSSMGQFLLGAGGKKNVFIAGLQQDIIDQTASAQAAAMRNLNEERRRLEARDLVRKISEPKEELRELMDPLKQLISLSRSLGDSFSESFKGIVSGSMTAQEALRNLFQRTANHFLDMAAQMIAKQIQMQILGIGLKFFSSGIAPSRGGNTGGTDRFGRDFDDPSFGMPRGQSLENFANGGRPPVGRPSIVGERGPELFMPDRAGTIIPNHAMGSTNVIVNVDASGSSVQSDGNGQQFGEALATAIQLEIIKQKRSGGLLS